MISLPYTLLLTAVAVVTGIGILIAFRIFSNRQALALAKRQVWAQLYALRLYSDELPVVWQVQKRLVAWNGRYLLQMFRPAAVVFLPLTMLLFVLDGFYGHRPLRSGEAALVIVHNDNQAVSLIGRGISIETPELRIPDLHTAYWRIRANRRPGDLVFGAHREPVRSGSGLAYISACPRCFGNPIDIRYPSAYVDVFGFQMSWLVWFLTVSAATMFALRKRFRVMF